MPQPPRRTTGDLLVLLIAGTVCSMVLMGGLAVAVIETIRPENSTDFLIGRISDAVNTLIGLLAGFLAGRTDQAQQQQQALQAERDQKPGQS